MARHLTMAASKCRDLREGVLRECHALATEVISSCSTPSLILPRWKTRGRKSD